jgi:Ser/Thr protein kinase RdoA (MazF antagonist)
LPEWVATGTALRQAAALLGRYHRAVESFDWGRVSGFSPELADPSAGEVVCHNDLCVENVVFRDDRAVGLLDFDFAAPGRRLWDAAMGARMWAPMTHPNRRDPWPGGMDAVARVGVFAQAYGVTVEETEDFVEALFATRQTGLAFVRRQIETGDPAYADMWRTRGGEERITRDEEWLSENRPCLVDAVAAHL